MLKIGHFTKWVVIINCCVPAFLLAWDALQGRLGANPVNFAIRTTGSLSLVFLVLTLGITPVMQLAGWNWLGQFRRIAGLYAFFHALVHFSIFFLYDRAGKVGDTLSEIALRPYLMVGSLGLLIMVPLAVTSTNTMIRRLGSKRWKALHRLTYVAAMAGAIHYYMLVKADVTWPVAFASAFAVLLGYRAFIYYRDLLYDARRFREGLAQSPAPANIRPKAWSGLLRVARIFVETPTVRTFRLVPVSGDQLPFRHQPGQFLTLTVEIDHSRMRRCYTIASSPAQSGYCELTIKREASGLVSRHMHDTIREGDVLQVTAPAGKFIFNGSGTDQIVLIAGGVGITPLMAKIRYLTDIGWQGSIHLILSARRREDIIFQQELESLQRRFANLRVTVTLTGETDAGWQGERGRLSREFLERVAPGIGRGLVHLCGPSEMTGPLIEILRAMGVPHESIDSEMFTSPSRRLSNPTAEFSNAGPIADVSISDAPFDGQSRDSTLEFARSGKTVANLNSRTVLEIAEEEGIEIPYDCRAGVCGQCRTKLLGGRVVHDAQDALSPADIANGFILACQARCLDEVSVDA